MKIKPTFPRASLSAAGTEPASREAGSERGPGPELCALSSSVEMHTKPEHPSALPSHEGRPGACTGEVCLESSGGGGQRRDEWFPTRGPVCVPGSFLWRWVLLRGLMMGRRGVTSSPETVLCVAEGGPAATGLLSCADGGVSGDHCSLSHDDTPLSQASPGGRAWPWMDASFSLIVKHTQLPQEVGDQVTTLAVWQMAPSGCVLAWWREEVLVSLPTRGPAPPALMTSSKPSPNAITLEVRARLSGDSAGHSRMISKML